MAGEQHLGANRRALDDAIVLLLLVNHVRRKVIASVFGLTGLTRDESLLLTLLALVALARNLEESAPTVRRPVAPTAVGWAVGAGGLGELGHAIGGKPSRAVPGFSALVAFALIWRYRPVLRISKGAVRELIRGIRFGEREIRTIYGERPDR